MTAQMVADLLDCATSCVMTFRDFRNSCVDIPVEGEAKDSILEFNAAYDKAYPISKWRIYLGAHIKALRPFEMKTKGNTLLFYPLPDGELKAKHRQVVFEFSIPDLMQHIEDVCYMD
jgi:hypothetical protein